MIQAGKLRHRVYYERLTQGPASPFGDSAQTPVSQIALWALVDILDGIDLVQAHQVHEQAKARITIRYNPQVVSSGRFIFEGQNFYITSVVPDPKKRQMVCICYVRPEENVT